MKKKYEKPITINLSSQKVVYGQEVTTYGLCSSGSAPAGEACGQGGQPGGGYYGCGVGNVVNPKCAVGIGVTDPKCTTGSAPYYGDVCSAGGTHTGS